VIAARRLQRHFGDGFVAEAVEDLWEPWMRHADVALEDDALLLLIQQELAQRCQKSKTRGRKATPAEVVLRMLLLKHVRDWKWLDLESIELTEDTGKSGKGQATRSPAHKAAVPPALQD
jgi:IS5 family transposase